MYWGIDGCKTGWICIGLGRDDSWDQQLVRKSEGLLTLPSLQAAALIDIPIGLVNESMSGRGCDRAARKALRFPRSCSVFSAPSRLTLNADSYRAACDINQKATGKKISRQAWAITQKIGEIDLLLRPYGGRTLPLRECHPEVCFWALNGNQPMRFNKKKAAGRQERLAVLSRFVPSAESIVSDISQSWLRKEVAVDDIVDALVAAVTAKLGSNGLMTLPEAPDTDKYKLPMEIVYALPN